MQNGAAICTVSPIGEKILLSSGSMTVAVNRLEAKGMTQRIQDPADARCFYLHLTKSGRRLVKIPLASTPETLNKLPTY